MFDKKTITFLLVVVILLSTTVYAIDKMSKTPPFQYNPNLSAPERIKRWISWITPKAKKLGAKHGLPWEALVAQTGWETGWGKSSLIADAYNFAGIKAVGNQPYVVRRTHEIRNGVEVWEDAKFRKFKSLEDGLEEYALFFHKNSRYAQALKYPRDPYQFIVEIRKAGYATSLNYVSNLHGILDNYIVGKNIPSYNFEGSDSLSFGSRGSNVEKLQKILNEIAEKNMIVQISTDGIFGKKTEALLERILGVKSITPEEIQNVVEQINIDKNCLLCGKPI